MSSSSVWVHLYYEGKDEPEGHPVEIIPMPEDVADLIMAVKTELELDAPLNLIFACPPGTTPPFSQYNAIDPGDPVPTGTFIRGDKILKELMDELGTKNPRVSIGYDHPLIVVAPAPKQQHQRFDAEKVTLYNIPNCNDVTSCKKIQGGSDLDEFIQISNTPGVLDWERGSDGSPTELPGEIAAPSTGSNVSSISTSTGGYIEKFFQTAVLERDKQKCVVSGEVYKQGSGNGEAAHIIPVASPLDVQRQAGLHNLYDTRNGMLLESTLHKAFDSYVWCMDEEGKFCLSDAESHAAKIKGYKLAKWEGNSLNLNIGLHPDAPTKETLKTRYNLFLSEVDKKKQKEWQRV